MSNSTLIVLENGETLRLTKSCQNQSFSKKVLNPAAVTKSPSVTSPSTGIKSGNSSSSPGISHSSPTNKGSGFVFLKRIQPQPVPIFQSPPVLSSSSPTTTSPRTRILPYSTQTDEKSIRNIPHSSLSPELGLDHAKLPLFAPNARLSSSSSFQNNSEDPVFNQKLVDRDAGLITQFVQFRPLLIRSPQSAIETNSNGPRLVIPLQSPQSNNSPSIPTRQSRLPHSALSPSAIGERNTNQLTLSIQSEDHEKQIQLITRINNKERDLGVSLMSQQEPVPKIFSKKPDSQSGIASIDEIDDVEIKRSLSRSLTFRDSSRISIPVEHALRNDQQISSLLQQLKLDLNMELSGVI